jgi:hypothetical protein
MSFDRAIPVTTAGQVPLRTGCSPGQRVHLPSSGGFTNGPQPEAFRPKAWDSSSRRQRRRKALTLGYSKAEGLAPVQCNPGPPRRPAAAIPAFRRSGLAWSEQGRGQPRFLSPVPEGHRDNSPAVHCWHPQRRPWFAATKQQPAPAGAEDSSSLFREPRSTGMICTPSYRTSWSFLQVRRLRPDLRRTHLHGQRQDKPYSQLSTPHSPFPAVAVCNAGVYSARSGKSATESS